MGGYCSSCGETGGCDCYTASTNPTHEAVERVNRALYVAFSQNKPLEVKPSDLRTIIAALDRVEGEKVEQVICEGGAITTEELAEIFGETMPWEAVALLQSEVASLGEIRDALKRLAALQDAQREILRLTDALAFAHSAGFEWPSDPLPTNSLAWVLRTIRGNERISEQ